MPSDSADFNNLLPWRVFLSLLSTGSMSRTAVELDLDVSRVSRLLTALETTIGRVLFNRHSRPLQPTIEAKEIEGKLRPVFAQWQAFEAFVTSAAAAKQTIRLSTPVGIGRLYLNRQIAEYAAIDPTICIDASVEAGVEELLSGAVDVVFVPYTPTNENLTVYPAMHAYTLPVASIDYVAAYGNPESPEELIRHTGILKTGNRFPVAETLLKNGHRRTVFWKQTIRHNDMLNVKDAVLKNLGIALDIPLGMLLDEIRRGEVVQVLDGWHRDYWSYSVVIRSTDTVNTPIGKFAAWYAQRATQEIDERRHRGFALLGVTEQIAETTIFCESNKSL